MPASEENSVGALSRIVEQARSLVPQPDPSNEWLAFGAGIGKPTTSGALSEALSNGMTGALNERTKRTDLEKTYMPLFMRALTPQVLGRTMVEPLTGREVARDSVWAEEQAEGRRTREFTAEMARQERLQRDRERQQEILRAEAARREENMRQERARAEQARQHAELVASLRGPKPEPHGTPVKIMRNGKAVMVDSLSGREIGEAPSDYKSGTLSPTMLKELTETDDAVLMSETGMSQLRSALGMNENSFSGPGAKMAATVASGLGNVIPGVTTPKADATIEMDNIIMNQALGSLKAIFGAAPTEGERKILLDLQASVNKTPSQRAAILARAHQMAEARMEYNRNKAKAIREGTFATQALPRIPDVNQFFDISKPAVGKFDLSNMESLKAGIAAIQDPLERSRAEQALANQLAGQGQTPAPAKPASATKRKFSRVEE